METFDTVPKQWGNSWGITIPKNIVVKEHLSDKTEITVLLITREKRERLRKAFGTLRLKKPTQQVMDELDAEAYE